MPGHPELALGIARAVSKVLAEWPQLTVTCTTDGKHAENSYHYQGRAVDLGTVPFNQLYQDRAAAWVAQHLRAELVEGIHNPSLSVKAGVAVNPSYWGAATWSAHRNHLHLAV